MNALDWVAWILVIVGALNWGLVGFFGYNLVGSLTGGDMSMAAKVVYDLVGIAALYIVVMMGGKMMDSK